MKTVLKGLVTLGIAVVASHALAQEVTASKFKKVVWVVFENTNYQNVMKQSDFANVTKLGATLQKMSGETHPSQGNYIAMIAGSVMGVANDKNIDLAESHIGDLLEKANLNWHVYAEDYPGNCYTGAKSGKYARKHVPFLSFTNVTSDSSRCAHVDKADRFFTDLEQKKHAEFSMYIPNLNNDGHDTGVNYAGHWMSTKFGSIFSNAAKYPDTLFIVTFDENEGTAGNQIYTVLIGAHVVPGSVNTQAVNHISLLKMIEDEFKIGHLGRQDVSAPVITGIWK